METFDRIFVDVIIFLPGSGKGPIFGYQDDK